MSRVRVTAWDVARLAQVSQSAVSRAFTPGASIATTTRERIHAAARTLGYRPNAIARALITRRSNIIGMVVSYLDNLFYAAVLERLSQALEARGLHVLLFMTADDDTDTVLREIQRFNVDAIVMLSATLSSSLARELAEGRVPVLLFNRGHDDADVNAVGSDNRAGGDLLGRLLLAAGHQRIAYVAGIADSTTNRDREAGFKQALAAQGATLFARADGGYNHALAADATRSLFSGPGPYPDAIFAANDAMALAVIDTLRHDLGLRVPTDVSVVGYDDVRQAAWPAYQLTTVRQPIDDMVTAAVEIIAAHLVGDAEPARKLALPAVLALRRSARLPADLSPFTTVTDHPDPNRSQDHAGL